MKVAIIAAVAENNTIGMKNKMPWHLPGDLKYFKTVTMGKPIIMGRKTFESLGKPLPGRVNIVISRDESYYHEDIRVVHSLSDALSLAVEIATTDGVDELIVIGGAEIFRQALPQAERLYLTRVHHSFEGDAFFPDFDDSQWQESSREDKCTDETSHLTYSYLVMDRKPNS
ncbi:MAG: dihydrofolate reductase [Candidatus Endonucleobacter bathymodioli]|uniref:Dihydrofolate reductase n=1 Tax=Candidatus Endonucleibacter bathymodioli TaxID=539814 RepID=A0AA90NXA9_9GAMM|nr:dihydrofolate reductase [Candidatus Endonucleobacter bathymodioli]